MDKQPTPLTRRRVILVAITSSLVVLTLSTSIIWITIASSQEDQKPENRTINVEPGNVNKPKTRPQDLFVDPLITEDDAEEADSVNIYDKEEIFPVTEKESATSQTRHESHEASGLGSGYSPFKSRIHFRDIITKVEEILKPTASEEKTGEDTDDFFDLLPTGTSAEINTVDDIIANEKLIHDVQFHHTEDNDNESTEESFKK